MTVPNEFSNHLSSEALVAGAVQPATVAGLDIVVWRTVSGRLCAVARSCPHLDWDLADATVEGETLVCPAHGWSITCAGRVFKCNDFGREDEKGVTRTWQTTERDGMITVTSQESE